MAVNNAEKVRLIRNLADQGHSQHGIARALGVPQSTVWNIIHRKQWSHIS
jgi:predicted transcriptional regulator